MNFEHIRLTNVMLDNDYSLEYQPYEYLFFCIPETQYPNLIEVVMELTASSGKAILVLNEYRGNNHPISINGQAKIAFSAEQCEAGENILAYKGQIQIQNVEFHLVTNTNEITNIEQIADAKGITNTNEIINTERIANRKTAMEFLLHSQIPSASRHFISDSSPTSSIESKESKTIPSNNKTKSIFDGSCFAIYDYTNGCHRMPCWLWSDAPIVSASLEMIHSGLYPEVKESLEQLAYSIGEVFLNTQILDKNEESYGALVSRFRYYGKKDYSFNRLLGMNDTSYSVKWALLPLYEYTGDKRYLESAIKALDWIERNIFALDFVPSHYYFEHKIWEQKAFVDTGFCPEGFEKYMQVVGNHDYISTIEYIMKRFLDQFSLGNGYYGQNYTPQKGVDNRLFTRGHAWVLEGLLSCMRITKKDFYQKKAEDLIYHLLPLQATDGSFSYLLGYGEPSEQELKGTGTCEKATAIFAYLFMEYNRIHPDTNIEISAKKALAWCEQHMSMEAGLGFGGIHASSLSSGITGLPYLDVATGYANAYYILASLL